MIRSRVSVLEEAMEIDPPVTDLSGDDNSTDSEYADVDDGGAMLVDDSEDERDQENVVPIPVPPPVIRLNTPRPPTILRELIPIEAPTPEPAMEVDEGEDDAWYIPPIHRRRIHPHWGQGYLDFSGNMLSTLQALRHFAQHLPSRNILFTFGM
jgi:hypothetical protein